MGWTVLPSQANFVLSCRPRRAAGKEAYLGLKSQGILVRYFDKPGLTDKIRITVGSNPQNNALLAGIKALSQATALHAHAQAQGRAVEPGVADVGEKPDQKKRAS
jgi:histidinol-phosphate/aromatic aminotransferase/cobyric acid decarboxylase-like protein